MKKTIEIIKLGNPEFNNKYEKPQKKPKHIRKVDWEGKRKRTKSHASRRN